MFVKSFYVNRDLVSYVALFSCVQLIVCCSASRAGILIQFCVRTLSRILGLYEVVIVRWWKRRYQFYYLGVEH